MESFVALSSGRSGGSDVQTTAHLLNYVLIKQNNDGLNCPVA